MAENSEISWTDHTFNPWMGCTKVSEGCKNCYAERDFDKRRHVVEWGKGKPRKRTTEAYWKQPLAWNRKAEKDGTRPRVFCASLADWLDPEVPVEWLADLLALIQATPHLDWLLLTKRPELWRVRVQQAWDSRYFSPGPHFMHQWVWEGKAPSNVWIGATVENQKNAARIPHLLNIPARVRFLSCEPLLGAVDIDRFLRPPPVCHYDDMKSGIHWVIAGGESGPDARPMHPDWARSLRDRCVAAGVPFHFKQWGEHLDRRHMEQLSLRDMKAWPKDLRKQTVWFSPEFNPLTMYQVGKKAAGRLLDGVEHNAFPLVGATA